MDFFPQIVQVIPHPDYTISVYFLDGKIVCYDITRRSLEWMARHFNVFVLMFVLLLFFLF